MPLSDEEKQEVQQIINAFWTQKVQKATDWFNKVKDWINKTKRLWLWIVGILATFVGAAVLYVFFQLQEDVAEIITRKSDFKEIKEKLIKELFEMKGQMELKKEELDRLNTDIATIQDQIKTLQRSDTVKVSEAAKALKDNPKVEEALQLLNRVDVLESNKITVGAVMAFQLETCPKGWWVYPAAYGRFIRGIDGSEQQIDPDGKRLPGSIQNDSFASHTHPHYMMGWGGGNHDPGHGRSDLNSPGQRWSDRTDPAGGAETRPKNVALLFCIKQ